MIRLEGVTKNFPGMTRPAVDSLSFDVPRGQIVALVGPSGCGKTTTLKMINRIIEPSGGKIWVDGVDATASEPHLLRRSIGYVIQQIGLFPHRTIAQNIATVPVLLEWDPDRIRQRVAELIELVGLDPDMGERYPSELSGGQQQRVGVARALAADPPVLLMDEPFGAVDPIVRGRLQDELLELQATVRKTIVFVTHDIDEAIHLGDQICILNVGGVLEQMAPPEEVLRDPANEFVEDFIGGDRGLKRLALRTVGETQLGAGPMVERGSSTAAADAAMAEYRTDWFGILDGDRLLGWLAREDLSGPTIDEDRIRPIRLTVDPSSTLRNALDTIVSSRSRLALVVHDGRYLGALDLNAIADEIR
jgi:osmoprotectant transport system ATP-binding protein